MDSQKMGTKEMIEKIFLPMLNLTIDLENLRKIKDAFVLIMNSLNLANDKHFSFLHEFIDYFTDLWEDKIFFYKWYPQNESKEQINIFFEIINRLEKEFANTPYAAVVKNQFIENIFEAMEYNQDNTIIISNRISARRTSGASELNNYLKQRMTGADPNSNLTDPPEFLQNLLDLIISPMNTSIPGHPEKIEAIFTSMHKDLDLTNEVERILFQNLTLVWLDCQLVVAKAINKLDLERKNQLLLENIATMTIILSPEYSPERKLLQAKFHEIKKTINYNHMVSKARAEESLKGMEEKTEYWLTIFPAGALKKKQ